jgi:hypothetical protein
MIKPSRMRWAGSVAYVGGNKNLHRILMGDAEGKTFQGGSRYRLEDYTKMDLKETELNDIDWIHLAQDRNQLVFGFLKMSNSKVPEKLTASQEETSCKELF